MQVVALEGSGIGKLSDLKGKRVSTGAPGSGVEIVALRMLEAAGLDAKKDLKQERLSVSNGQRNQGSEARRVFLGRRVPTAAITDLAATPGVKIKLIDHAEVADAMNKKYGPLYTSGVIPAGSYSGQDKPNANIDIWNILVANDKMSDKMAYDIVKTLFEKKADLVAVHQEAQNIDLKNQAIGSPIPFIRARRNISKRRASGQMTAHAPVATFDGWRLSDPRGIGDRRGRQRRTAVQGRQFIAEEEGAASRYRLARH